MTQPGMRDEPKGDESKDYDRPSVTVDIVIFRVQDHDLRALLIQRKHPPFAGCWAIPGGFVNIDESLEAAARRELQEETGIGVGFLEQVHTFGEPGRDPRGRTISVAYFALLAKDEAAEAHAGDDAEHASWFSAYSLPELAFDHADIMRHALERLRFAMEYSALASKLLPPEFTMSEMRALYEIVLSHRLDPAQFRHKVQCAGLIEPTGSVTDGQRQRMRRYRFRRGPADPSDAAGSFS